MTRPVPPAVRRASDPAEDGRPAPPGPRRSGGPRGPFPRRTVLIALIALTVLVAGGTWAVYGSSLLRAEKVTVGGNQELTDDQIIKAGAVPLGGPLVSVDTGSVRKRLLAALPRVKQVTVQRSWPHTIRLKVTERTPSAVLKSGSRFTEVDRDGVRFATVSSAPRGAPLVQLTDPQSASVRQFGTKRLLQAAIAVSGDLPETLHGQATAIRVRSYDGITVELSGGRDVVWGSEEDGTLKASVLTALMKARPGASHFDVSAPTAPAASGS
jgi:cell division protein FtsQ